MLVLFKQRLGPHCTGNPVGYERLLVLDCPVLQDVWVPMHLAMAITSSQSVCSFCPDIKRPLPPVCCNFFLFASLMH